MNIKIENINIKLENLNTKIENIENIINKKNINNNNKIIEIKREKNILDIPIKFIIQCLNYRSVRGDAEIFKYYYLKNSTLPIKKGKSNRIFYYYNNSEWIEDVNGEYIKDIIIYNIFNTYKKTNLIENYDKSLGDSKFLLNQYYINRNYKNMSKQHIN